MWIPSQKDGIGLVVLTVVLAVTVMTFRQGWEVPALSGHEFRQAQTALSIQAMQQTGFQFDYETPVLGKPWAIPMEFPLYQYLVVRYIDLSGDGIPQAARAVAAIAFLVGLAACFGLMRWSGYTSGASAVALCPVCLAPVYLFYSRTVMIESLAWALSAWFLLAILHFHRGGNRTWLLVAVGAGAAAVLVKATTWAAFCLPWALVFLSDTWRSRSGWRDKWRRWSGEAALGLVLLAVGWGWVAYADAVKAQNVIGQFLVSDQLIGFNFGSMELRGAGQFWGKLWGYWTQAVAAPPVLVLGLLTALLWSRSRMVAGVGLFSFLGIQLIFSGLFFAHDYYLYANAAFVLFAVGAGLASAWEAAQLTRSKSAVMLGLVVMLGWQYRTFQIHYAPTQMAPATGPVGLTAALQYLTEPEDVIVAHSPDWNSSWPYYAERRMLLIPDAEMFLHPQRAVAAVDALQDESVPLFMMIGASRVQPRWLAERIEQLNLWPVPLFEWAGQVDVYAAKTRYQEFRERLVGTEFSLVEQDASQEFLPAAERVLLSTLPEFEKLISLGIEAHEGVLPYGISMVENMGQQALLFHAVSELHFLVPEGATQVELRYGVNPDAYNHVDFDGMAIRLDFMDETGNPVPLYFDWLSPEAEPAMVHQEISLPINSYDTLVLRALPGPRQSSAFDQGVLQYLRFK